MSGASADQALASLRSRKLLQSRTDQVYHRTLTKEQSNRMFIVKRHNFLKEQKKINSGLVNEDNMAKDARSKSRSVSQQRQRDKGKQYGRVEMKTAHKSRDLSPISQGSMQKQMKTSMKRNKGAHSQLVMQEDIVTEMRKRPYFADSRTVKKPKTMQNTSNL